ncbi:MAG: ribonuclease III [Arenicellales bacterium WSBS_2016_MAG_OTU3]
MTKTDNLDALASKLNYEFSDYDHLRQAITHRSYSKINNERLEFLGDSILNFIVAENLFHKFPLSPEGVMTRLRSQVVCGDALTCVGKNIKVSQFLKLGAGEAKSGGYNRASTIANAVEALIGVIYLDGGLRAARTFVLREFSVFLEALNPNQLNKDSKTRLQEYLQQRGEQLPVYEVIETKGPPHLQTFTVTCDVGGEAGVFTRSGLSRKQAEQESANAALESIVPKEP